MIQNLKTFQKLTPCSHTYSHPRTHIMSFCTMYVFNTKLHKLWLTHRSQKYSNHHFMASSWNKAHGDLWHDALLILVYMGKFMSLVLNSISKLLSRLVICAHMKGLEINTVQYLFLSFVYYFKIPKYILNFLTLVPWQLRLMELKEPKRTQN